MSKKEGDFEGEYDFFNRDEDDEDDDKDDTEDDDEIEQELTEDEIDESLEDEDLDEDLIKEKKKREFLSNRQQELADNTTAFIANQGYVEKYPNISLSDVINGDYVTFLIEDENKSQMLNEDELELWIKGKLKFDKAEEDVIRKWYPSGTYRFFKMLTNLKKRYTLEEDESKWKNLEDLIELNTEKFRIAKKVELAEAYNESGERLDNLYLALYGRTDKRHFDMGCFRVSIPVLFYNDEMKKSRYEDSDSFFKDFKNAREFIFSLKGEPVVGTLTDSPYEFIGGYAYGEADIELGDRAFEINAGIEREEWFDKKTCYSKVRDIYITNEDFIYWINKCHPELNVGITREDTVIFGKGDDVSGEYYPEAEDGFHLAIQGPIEKQEKLIKSLLEYITEEGLPGNDYSDEEMDD